MTHMHTDIACIEYTHMGGGCEVLTWSNDLSRPGLDYQLLAVQVFDGELTATQRLVEGDGLVHDEVNVCSPEDWVVLLLEDDYDIARITIRLGGRGGGEGRGGIELYLLG